MYDSFNDGEQLEDVSSNTKAYFTAGYLVNLIYKTHLESNISLSEITFVLIDIYKNPYCDVFAADFRHLLIHRT